MLSVALEKSNWPCLRNIRRGKFIWIFVHSAAQELHFWVVGYSRHGLLVFLCFLSFLLNNCFVRLVSIEPSNFLCQSKEWGTFLCYVRILLFIRHYTFHLASCKQFRCIPLLGGLAGCAGVSFVFWIWAAGGTGCRLTWVRWKIFWTKWWVVYSVLFVCPALVCLFAALITCTFLHNTPHSTSLFAWCILFFCLFVFVVFIVGCT